MSHVHTQSTSRRIARISVLALIAFALAATSATVLAQGGSAKGPATTEKFDITLTSTPNPPKMGENAFAVTVKGPDGKPVTDAEVMAMFYMAAMPAMNMKEMKSNVMLKHESNGKYVGKGQVMMAGKWDVTVMVKRGGKEVASKKLPVTAQ